MNDERDIPILVIADLHGNVSLLKKALRRGVELNGFVKDGLIVVLLGDLVDNGPEVPQLLEYLSTEAWKNDSVADYIKDLKCICGNHDMMMLLSISPENFNVSPSYRYITKSGNSVSAWEKWTNNFHNVGGETNLQYNNSMNHRELLCNIPHHHKKYLEELPLFLLIEPYLFVHAGIRDPEVQPLEEQLAFLIKRDLSDMPIFDAIKCPTGHCYGRGRNYGIPDQLANKDWNKSNYPAAEVIVVTGHNKYEEERNFVASHRIGFHSCACWIPMFPDVPLNCAILRRGRKGQSVDDLPPLFFTVTILEAV